MKVAVRSCNSKIIVIYFLEKTIYKITKATRYNLFMRSLKCEKLKYPNNCSGRDG